MPGRPTKCRRYAAQLAMCLLLCAAAAFLLVQPVSVSTARYEAAAFLPFIGRPLPSPTATPTATPLPRKPDVRIEWSCSNVRGGSAQDPNGEWVCFRNHDAQPVDMLSWYVQDSVLRRYTFRAFFLSPGATVRLHSGIGADLTEELYWGRGLVWNNDHDSVDLYDRFGRSVSHLQY